MNNTYPDLPVRSRSQWRAWLAANGRLSRGVWVVTFKKGCTAHVPYADIVEEALAAGWIDSRPRSIDGARSALLVTPRKPTSRWSRVNKERVERLLAEGLMQPAGIAALDIALASGTWNALDAVENLTEPEDLTEALDTVEGARRHWDAFPRSTRRAILEWIGTAKTDETRRRRINRTVSDAAVGIRANQWRQPKQG